MSIERYEPLSDAKPDVRHRRAVRDIQKIQSDQQQEDARAIEMQGRQQRLAASLSDLTAMGLPESETLEVVSFIPTRGIRGYLERRKAQEAIDVSWQTTVLNREFATWQWRWLDRLLIVQDVVEGYQLDNYSDRNWRYGSRGTVRRYLLASNEVGVELSPYDVKFPDNGLSFQARGCIGIFADSLVPLEACTTLVEESVASLEDKVLANISKNES